MAEKLGGEDVWNALDVVSGAGMPFYAYAQTAHFLDPAPNLLACNADFLGDFLSADDDGGVLGKEREQRVDAPVGCARQVRHTFGGHRGLERILERRRGYKPGQEWKDWIADEQFWFRLEICPCRVLNELQFASQSSVRNARVQVESSADDLGFREPTDSGAVWDRAAFSDAARKPSPQISL